MFRRVQDILELKGLKRFTFNANAKIKQGIFQRRKGSFSIVLLSQICGTKKYEIHKVHFPTGEEKCYFVGNSKIHNSGELYPKHYKHRGIRHREGIARKKLPVT